MTQRTGGVLGPLIAMLAWPYVTAGSEPSSSPMLTIEHKAVGCVQVGRFPRFEAGVSPSEEVSRIRLRFRPGGFNDWYSVAMKLEGRMFAAALPKPKKSLEALDYYIEVTDHAFGTIRTEEYRAQVVSGPIACQQGKMMGGSVASASIAIEVPAGAPVVPGGFASAGVVTAGTSAGAVGGAAVGPGTAAGSGLSGAAIAGIAVGGAAAVAGGVALATHQSPTPSMTVTAGTWSYVLSINVPLNATPGCMVGSTGSMVVSSIGAFSIPFSVACARCAMSGTVTGTIAPTGVSGSVAAALSGPIAGPGGCSNGITSPVAISGGACDSTNNSITACAFTMPPAAGYNVSGILTPP